MKRLVALLIGIYCIVSVSSFAQQIPEDLRDGDIIFQSPNSLVNQAIQQATNSPYSHVGMILFVSGQPMVFEASGPVGFAPLEEWVTRGDKHHFVIKRLKHADSLLTKEAVDKLRATALTFSGRSYDFVFNWSDDQLYCSELVWKIYDRALGIKIGEARKLRDYSLSSPLVQAKLRERYGDNVPMDEPMVSPGVLFDSSLLATVAER